MRRSRLAVFLVVMLSWGCGTPRQPDTAPAPGASAQPAPIVVAAPPTKPAGAPLLGAYYYSWYPQNLRDGTLAAHLVPPRAPDPATYRSGDPAVAEQAIAQASAAGIDFFALDYWPSQPTRDAAIDTGFLQAANLHAMRFAVLYETQDIVKSVPYSIQTRLTPSVSARLVADMVGVAKKYFSNPQYLRVGGRPVLFWYLTRILTGDVAGTVASVRAALAALGYDVLLVGDEMFWRVTMPTGAETTAPQVARARLFDAITWYNLYDATTPGLAGYGSTSPFIAAANSLVARYRTALGGAPPVVPDVVPGYNDRGVRLDENHPAIPRQWAPGDSDGSFLRHMYTDLALPAVSADLPMVMVSTWNEWNEDTAIQPSIPTTPTARDDSPTGTAYSQGYRYGSLGTPELDVLRQVSRLPGPG